MQLKFVSLGLTIAALMVSADADGLVKISNNKVIADNIGNNLLKGTSLSNILTNLRLSLLSKRGLNRPEMVARAVHNLNEQGDAAPKTTYVFIAGEDEQEEEEEEEEANEFPNFIDDMTRRSLLFGDDFSGEGGEYDSLIGRSLLFGDDFSGESGEYDSLIGRSLLSDDGISSEGGEFEGLISRSFINDDILGEDGESDGSTQQSPPPSNAGNYVDDIFGR